MDTQYSATALLIIDAQQGFDDPFWGNRNNPQAESNILQVLQQWRQQQRPVIHIQHCSESPNSPLHPSQSGHSYKPETQPIAGEKEFKKTVNSAFINTGLEEYLHQQSITSLVVVGLTTDHCVSTSIRMAGNLGFNVTMLSDATATFDRTDKNNTYYTAKEIHQIHCLSLDGEFCTVITTSECLKCIENH